MKRLATFFLALLLALPGCGAGEPPPTADDTLAVLQALSEEYIHHMSGLVDVEEDDRLILFHLYGFEEILPVYSGWVTGRFGQLPGRVLVQGEGGERFNTAEEARDRFGAVYDESPSGEWTAYRFTLLSATSRTAVVSVDVEFPPHHLVGGGYEVTLNKDEAGWAIATVEMTWII